MMRKVFILQVFVLFSAGISSQGIQDSLFKVPPVTVSFDKKFIPEEAGMKKTDIDSVILLKNINLSLSELLSENTQVYIKDHGRGALATASFRGTAPSHTQVSWNGININSPMAGMVDFSLIPVYIIDDLGLKHGTSSIADRSGGLGGSINISSKADWSNRLSGKYVQGLGSYRSFDEFFQFNAGNSKIQSKTRIYHTYSKNDYTFINRAIGNIDPATGQIINPVDTNKNAAYRKYGLLQELYFRPGEYDFLSVKYWVQDACRTIPRATSYEGPTNSNLSKQRDTDHRISADWTHFSESSTLTLRSGYTSKRLDYILKNPVHGLGLQPVIYSESRQKSFLNKAGYSYKGQNDFSLEASVDANYFVVNTYDTVSNAGYEGNRLEFSSFLSLHKQFASRVNINLMIRQDIIDEKFVQPIPYLGFDFIPFRTIDLIIKGNIAGNYHHPSLNELYWEPGGNKDLKPERGYSFEAGIEYSSDLINQKIDTEITLYRSDIKNWILWIPGFKGYWEPDNIKKVISKGIEINLGINGCLKDIKYSISGNYAYTRSINYGDRQIWGDESYGKQLVYIPLHSGNIFTKITYKGYSLSMQHNSYSERYTTSSNDISKRHRLYPYFMNNFTAGKELVAGRFLLSAELKINNLFNETYRSILYRPMPGRNYMLILMVKF